MSALMIRIGDFFFRTRNHAFPLIMLGLYLLAVPPAEVFESVWLEHAKDILALLIALSGLAVRASVIGYAYIKRGGLNKKVYAEDLVTAGMFSLCRNPLYVGNMLIYCGVFLMHGNPEVMLLGIGFYAFIYQCIVLAEERYLANKFGGAYKAYCADVPRWLPKLSRYRAATEGMRFNARKVVMKDYTTMATTVIMLALTEMYEYLELPDVSMHLPYLTLLIATVVGMAVLVAVVRTLKKTLWAA